jgi:hypothetical protein
MTQPLPEHMSRSWAWTLLLLVLLMLRLPSLARPAGGDQYLYTYEGQRVADAGVPYRDAWDQKPPGIMFVYATGWRLWPRESLAAALDLAATALVAWILVHLGRRAFGGRAGEGAAALFLLLGDPGIQRLGGQYLRAQCETFIALAVTAAVALAWRSFDRRRVWMVAGIWLSVAFWLKYNAAVYALPVGLAAALPANGPIDRRRSLRALAWMAVGGVTASAVVLIYFAVSGALADLWLATISYNVRYSGETYAGLADALRYVATMPFGRARVDGLWFVGLLGLLPLVAFRRPNRMTAVTLLWLAAAVLSIAINGSRGLPQYFIQAAPALALAGAAGLAAMWEARGRARILAGVVGLALLAGVWRVGVEGPWSRPRLLGLPQAAANIADDVRYLRGGMTRDDYLARFDRGDGGKFSPAAIDRLAGRVRETTAATDRVLVFGFAGGGVLARAQRVSASRFFWSRPVVLEFAADRPDYGSMGLLADLHHTPPALVALQKHDWGLAEATTPDSIDFFMNNPALRAWLEAGYAPDYEDAAFSVWRKKR